MGHWAASPSSPSRRLQYFVLFFLIFRGQFPISSCISRNHITAQHLSDGLWKESSKLSFLAAATYFSDINNFLNLRSK
jgi:hypothetical protein